MVSKVTAPIPEKLIALVYEVISEFFTDNCAHLAAAISYYLLFSLFPFTLAIISITGFILRSPELEAQVIEVIGNFLPVSGEFITRTIRGVVSARGAIGVIATIGLLWGGTSVMNVVRKSLNTAWGIRQIRPFLHARLVELAMLCGVSVLLFMSIALTAGLRLIQRLNSPVFQWLLSDGGSFWSLIIILISIAFTYVVFLFLYKFVPNTRVRWRDVWMGALAATFCFEVAKVGFVWFVQNYSTYNIIYGSLGTIIALMMWTYVSAVLLLFFAKLTSVYARFMSSGQIARPEPQAANCEIKTNGT